MGAGYGLFWEDSPISPSMIGTRLAAWMANYCCTGWSDKRSFGHAVVGSFFYALSDQCNENVVVGAKWWKAPRVEDYLYTRK